HSRMTDDRKPSRRPFGERDDQDRQRPFGAVTGGPSRPTPPPGPPPDEPEPSPDDSIASDDGITAADDGIAADDDDADVVRRADTPSHFPAPFGSRRGGYRPMESYYEGLREPDPDPDPDPE